jgi:hypothetical protein
MQVMAMTAEDFAALFEKVGRHQRSHNMVYRAWMAMTGCISTLQLYAQNGWENVPSPKQTNQILKAQNFVREREGDESESEE